MWTKDGAETLPLVLGRIDEIIPQETVNKRIIIDDHSKDETREIAKAFGWQVIFNEGKGISDGANTGLKHVASSHFISFEQDLLLAKEWWQKIPPHLSGDDVIIASGIRLTKHPPALRKLEEYTFERYERRMHLEKDYENLHSGKTIDNTIYKTEALRRLGGFPRLLNSTATDAELARRVSLAGYEWKVDYGVRSVHLRKGLRDELAHRYWYGSCWKRDDPWTKPILLRFLFSPFRGLQIAINKKAPEIVYIYPLLRFYTLKGVLLRGTRSK